MKAGECQEQRLDLQRCSATLKLVIESGVDRLTGELRKQYRRVSEQAGALVSTWAVTSLSARGRVPMQPGFFDLVIFDEASQCDIASALPLLYRAKRAVVIGDPKQLRHISALPRGQDQRLLSKHQLVESHVDWAYSQQSLFDLTVGHAMPGVIALRDHHRSHADIIEFSNRCFYDGNLRVATRYSALKRPSEKERGVRWVDVRGRVTAPEGSGALNPEEARAVVTELRHLVIDGGYQGDVGVISPFRAQANRINELVRRDDELAEALDRRNFLCDTVHRFQGDERDVMFFSPVLSTGMPQGPTTFLQRNPNLFNVAITRARSALVVVGDCDRVQESDVGHLKHFATYCQGLRPELESAITAQPTGPEYPVVADPSLVSDWERVLYKALFQAGIRPIPQYPVEKYLLDLALISGERRLDIEVDGERYHMSWDGEICRRDVIRNQRMFEMGWDVMRFWVYEIRDDLPGSVARVKRWLENP